MEVIHNGKSFHTEEDLYKALITESIITSYKNNPKFRQTNVLTTSVYRILVEMFINKKKIIFLDAPTGTGKSIIGYMVHFGFDYIAFKAAKYGLDNWNEVETQPQSTYTLTSSKLLQEQMESDVETFSMDDNFAVLKGSSNYECTLGTEMHKTKIDYPNRECKGFKAEQLQALPCYDTCPYIQRRFKAASSPSAIVNYAYFLTVMNAEFSPYFGKRDLVIADEGHLVPQIVTGMYGVDVTMFNLNKLVKLHNLMDLNYGKSLSVQLNIIKADLIKFHKFFESDKTNKNIMDIMDFLSEFKVLCRTFTGLSEIVKVENGEIYPSFLEMFRKDLSDVEDKMITMSYDKSMKYLMSLSKRPEDIVIESEEIGTFSQIIGQHMISQRKFFKFKVRDLSESELTKKYFLEHTKYVLFMSATIGDVDEFANLLGLESSQYSGFNIPSTFNFDRSPIYLCNSGYLNYNSFDSNIQKILSDTISILKKEHPTDKGIVHTSTFHITNMLKEQLHRQDNKNFSRYLFYQTSDEKESCINLMKSSKKPLVIIGPSLYEGLDLKDDLGRFNIIVKAPYSGIDNYTREKMKRYPYWYERETKEKLMQAIGRTNRHIEDWSKVYLIDSSLDKLIWKLPEYITSRIKKFRI